MTDPVDRAQDLEQRQRAKALRVTRDRLKVGGCVDCIDCGNEIPPARRAAYPAAVRCAGCQGLAEKELNR